MAPFDSAVSPSGTTRLTANDALNSGSSQHGKARRASAGSNWVAAMAASVPSSVPERAAVEAVELVVEDAREPEEQQVAGGGLEHLVEGDRGPLRLLVQGHLPGQGTAAGRLQAGLGNL